MEFAVSEIPSCCHDGCAKLRIHIIFLKESNLSLDISYNQSAFSFCILQRGIYLQIEVSKGNLLLKF